MFSRFFIDRPIFAAVLSIFLVLAGLAAMRTLPIAQYPEIAPPVVTVRAVYPGASAEVLEQTVAAPLENQINGVENMLYMASNSSSNGAVELNVTFDPTAAGSTSGQLTVVSNSSTASSMSPVGANVCTSIFAKTWHKQSSNQAAWLKKR